MKRSRANGPGIRTVIWVQGCTIGCPGCFNPSTHSRAPQQLMKSEDLLATVTYDSKDVEGLTISGGEPFEQPEGLLEFLGLVRERTSLSVIVFSGFEIEHIGSISRGPEILQQADVLISGPFVKALRLSRGLRGSSNQRIHLLTDRYSLSQVCEIPSAEVTVDCHGHITVSGIDPPGITGAERKSSP